MRVIKQSSARNVMVLMVQSSDHITGITGATLTITASKDGAAFASITPTVTERGSGWYNLALTSSHTDTLGDLAVHVTASSADPADFACQVVAYDTTSATSLGLSNLDAAITSRMASYTQPTGFLTTTFPAGTVASTTNITAGTITTVTAVTGLTASNLDVAVSSRLATAGYTAPDNASITSIKAKTDSLTFNVAGYVDSNIRYVNSIAVNGDGTSGTPWGP